MTTLNDEILRATGGPTINDGLSTYFARTPAESLQDAESRWLIGQGAALKPYWGPNFIDGGDFSNPDDWNPNDGWSVEGGKAISVGGVAASISQGHTIKTGVNYQLQFTVESIDSGTVRQRLGATAQGLDRTTPGTYKETIVGGTNDIAQLQTLSDTVCVCDNFSVQEELFTYGSLSDMWFTYLRGLGHTGALNDMLTQYWTSIP
jgi:hypothetical protein